MTQPSENDDTLEQAKLAIDVLRNITQIVTDAAKLPDKPKKAEAVLQEIQEELYRIKLESAPKPMDPETVQQFVNFLKGGLDELGNPSYY